MMDDRLLKILQELTDAEAEVEGVLYFLEVLDEFYESKHKQEVCYGVQVLAGWMRNLQVEMVQVLDKLDRYILEQQ